ncbi:MAG: MFS transporter [Chloroflexi bacterium]|nr:MFS transporter [Chloroflexota bacterium]
MSPLRLIILTLIRVTLSVAHRMVYPFLAIFARGLGVDLATVSALVANRALFGAATPFIFPFLEARGRKFGMALGIGLFVAGMTLVVVSPSLFTLGAALILAMVGKAFFDPSVIAYLADHTPYERRGLITAISEVSWSSAFIAGVPLMGFLLAKFGWTSPFVALGLLGIFSLAAILFLIRDTHPVATHKDGALRNVRAIVTSPSAMAALSIGLFATMANEMVNLMFGVWLEDSFHLQITALAAASAIIGFSELSGEGIVALFADRLGKVRATGLGIAVNCVAALILPIIGRTETGALIGLFLFYISFEVTIVSLIPLMSEITPKARATTLSFSAAAHSLGRALGAFSAPLLYALGFGAVTGAAVAVNLLALAAVWYVARRHQ